MAGGGGDHARADRPAELQGEQRDPAAALHQHRMAGPDRRCAGQGRPGSQSGAWQRGRLVEGQAARHPDDCLLAMAEDLGRDLASDRMMIVSHRSDEQPELLYDSGGGMSDGLLSSAHDAANDGTTNAVSWSRPSGSSQTAEIITGRFDVGSVTITVSAFFRRLGISKHKEVGRLVGPLLPVMRAFFRMRALRAQALANNHGMTAALNSSDIATILIDAEGLVVFANTAAERLIARKDGVFRIGRKLAGRRLADTVRLQATVEHVVQGNDGGQDGTPVFPLTRDTGRSLLATVVSAGVTLPDTGHVAAILHVFDPAQGLDKLIAPVCRLYGLTAVETGLALLLVEGRSLTEASKLLRIQAQTARSYLKQIFTKTKVNRQSELTSLLLRSAVRTDSILPLTFI